MGITREELLSGMKRGREIKKKAKEKGIPIWWLAKACDLNDGNFSRILRDLSEENYKKLNDMIKDLSSEK